MMDVVRKGYSVIKRFSLLIVAALLAAMMMVAMAAPAFASAREGEVATQCKGGNPHCDPVVLNGGGTKISKAKGKCEGCVVDTKFTKGKIT